MKYVPNLIPEHSRVNIDFSKADKVKRNSDLIKYLLLAGSGIFILAGLINIFTRFYVGLPLLIAGVVLIPDVTKIIEETLQFNFNLKLRSIFILICIGIASFTLPDYQAEEKAAAAVEKAKQEKALAEEKKRKEEEERKQKIKQEFLSAYPFITDGEYNNWVTLSNDSIKNPHFTKASFVSLKKKEFVKRQQDSIKLAHEEERKEKAEARKRKLEQQKAYEDNTEYYNGHVVFTGPRGGKYYINSNGNKTYIHR
ncbi:MAG: hypothetical protein K2X86_15740 [Cytophagaceae bacterium]|nr:hypothetical protein [Cytophagaceae bacterium]